MEKTTKKSTAKTTSTKTTAAKATAKTTAKTSSKVATKTSTKAVKTEPKNSPSNQVKITPRTNPAKAKRALLNEQKASTDAPKNTSSQITTRNTNITNAKLISALKVIENISHTLGISDRERINFDIEQVSDNELKIRIVNAAANFHSPWFAIKNEEPYIFMPAEILDVVFKMLKTAQKESFELKLERSIWQNMPIDFGDVWRVAMDELMKSEFKKEPDLDKLIAKIKREHPNLFMDVNQMLG